MDSQTTLLPTAYVWEASWFGWCNEWGGSRPAWTRINPLANGLHQQWVMNIKQVVSHAHCGGIEMSSVQWCSWQTSSLLSIDENVMTLASASVSNAGGCCIGSLTWQKSPDSKRTMRLYKQRTESVVADVDRWNGLTVVGEKVGFDFMQVTTRHSTDLIPLVRNILVQVQVQSRRVARTGPRRRARHDESCSPAELQNSLSFYCHGNGWLVQESVQYVIALSDWNRKKTIVIKNPINNSAQNARNTFAYFRVDTQTDLPMQIWFPWQGN